MLAGNDREALIWVADQLCIELGYAGEEVPGSGSALGGDGGPMSGLLNAEDEALVDTLRRGLARVAATVGATDLNTESERAVGAALDGSEMVMRGELVRGNAEILPTLLPSFVFLVTLPVVDQNRALELSRRATELLDAARPG